MSNDTFSPPHPTAENEHPFTSFVECCRVSVLSEQSIIYIHIYSCINEEGIPVRAEYYIAVEGTEYASP